MKKILIFVVAVSMMFSSFAFADSAEDLILSRNVIDEMLYYQYGYSETTLYAGSHAVGEDIAPGTYVLAVSPNTSTSRISIKNADNSVYLSESIMYDVAQHTSLNASRQRITVELKPGMIMMIFGHPITFITYNGI